MMYNQLHMPGYIAYYRISPGGRRKNKKLLQADVDALQDETLGLEAQRRDVARYLRSLPDQPTLTNEHTEIESGRNHKNRPILLAAIAECKRRKATLVIAKLDRLARNVHFISGLMESKVEFVAVDMPSATPLTIHILAAVAEDERKRISSRIKAALAVLKAKGVKLGNPNLAAAREKSRTALRRIQPGASPETILLIQEWRQQGWSLPRIAGTLNDKGIKAPKGGKWWGSSVRNQL